MKNAAVVALMWRAGLVSTPRLTVDRGIFKLTLYLVSLRNYGTQFKTLAKQSVGRQRRELEFRSALGRGAASRQRLRRQPL